MERFCDELRWEREQRKVSIEAICAVTKVSSRYVKALEAGDYGELPGGVFRKGILRSYLSVLGLDEESWVARFEESLRENGDKGANVADWVEFAENVRKARVGTESQTGMRWLGVMGMFALLMLFGWLVWTFVLHRRIEAARAMNVGVIRRAAAITPGDKYEPSIERLTQRHMLTEVGWNRV
jgi:cytoskeleton protein RodZ